ncbi:TPA: ogr/Delta-like zinc finger family protein [Klebsiella quasipneumoniae subsp. similipneumoniae]|uniref:ogr/Delta-like zinc finger family protein n=1 Tax=Klebsiella quasipneumoniae TaxID=1463165 RepID=UPI00188863D0|nr:ogr/Delta-like zinc finger family protein [Klebsiella quasipneumoniae]HCM4284635.1 ogr/Delta-like zinc finger family protein [Klebsiella quasipneumoniae]HDH1376093.1 ogr/Delta-like zinc finger family protein [Klebsiella quasipneumoniae subsp. similipneumoniae]
MFKYPVCGAVAKTRTSRSLSNTTVRHYHQCQNFEYSITFSTLNSVEKLVTKRAPREKLPPGFIPFDAFPASHYGNDQLSFAI